MAVQKVFYASVGDIQHEYFVQNTPEIVRIFKRLEKKNFSTLDNKQKTTLTLGSQLRTQDTK